MESKSACTRGGGETENLQMYADTSEGTSEGHFLQAIARYMDGQDDMFSDVDTGGYLWILVIAAAWLVKTEEFRGRPCGKKMIFLVFGGGPGWNVIEYACWLVFATFDWSSNAGNSEFFFR